MVNVANTFWFIYKFICSVFFWSEQKTKIDGAHDKLILRPVLMIISFVVGGWAESGAAILQPEVFC